MTPLPKETPDFKSQFPEAYAKYVLGKDETEISNKIIDEYRDKYYNQIVKKEEPLEIASLIDIFGD